MKQNPTPKQEPTLRQQAEKALIEKKAIPTHKLSETDAQILIHELQVAQIELELQNEELQSLNEELQTVNLKHQTKISDLEHVTNDLNNLLNSTELAKLFVDKELNVRRFTASITEIFKLRDSDIGRPFTDLVNDLKYPELEQHARQVLKSLAPLETSIVTTKAQWFSVRIVPYRTIDDRINGLVITFTDITELEKLREELTKTNELLQEKITAVDITEQKRAEKLLLESEAKFKNSFEASPIPFALNDFDGNITDLNSAFIHTFGYPSSDIPTLNDWWPSAYPDIEYRHWVAREWKKRLDTMLQNGSAFEPLELNIRCKDGSTKVVLASAAFLEKSLQGLHQVILVDITERITAEKKINLLQQKYFAILNAANGIVWEADAQTFQFTFVSGQAEAILGYPIHRWTDEPTFWKDHIHPEDRTWAVDYCLSCTLKNQAHDFEYRMTAADGRVVWLHDIVSVESENGKPVLLRGLMVDITERKQAEEKLATTFKELSQASKIQESILSALPANISLIDNQGIIIAVNEAWRKFGVENNLSNPNQCIGDNYIEISNNATGEDAEFGKKIAKGILKVLNNELPSFEMEYPCDSPSEKRWFKAEVTPLIKGQSVGAVVMHTNITERKHSEAEIENISRRLQLATQAANIGIWEYAINDGSLIWDDQMYALYGITKTTFSDTYEAWQAGLHAEDKERGDQEIGQAIAGKKDFNTEFRVMWPDQSIHHIRAFGKVILDDTGKAIKMIGANYDISDLKKLKDKIVEKELLLTSIVDSSPSNIFAFDLAHRFTLMNETMARFNGMAKEDVTGKTLHEVFPTDLADQLLAVNTNVISTGKTTTREEVVFSKATNETHVLQTLKFPLRNPQGQIIGMAGVATDITEIRKKEAEVLKANRLLQTVNSINSKLLTTLTLQEALDAICQILIEDGAFQMSWVGWVNATTQRVEPISVFGDTFNYVKDIVVYADDRPEGRGPIGIALREGNSVVVQDAMKDPRMAFWAINRTKTTWNSSVAIPILMKNGSKAVLVVYINEKNYFGEQEVTMLESVVSNFRIITEQNQTESALNNQRQLRSSQLLNFVHITSHNLRSPVSNLNSLLHFYKESTSEEDKTMLFTKFETVIHHLSSTLNDLVESLKIQEDVNKERQLLSFKDILHKTKEILSGHIIETNAVISCDFSKAEAIEYPKSYLESIMLNLCTNAIKYRSPERTPIIHFQTDNVNDELSMTATDNGLGIDLKRQGSKLFGLNKTFHKHADAKGFGLFITKSQVEAMGGHISAESEVDKGTTFRIVFNSNK